MTPSFTITAARAALATQLASQLTASQITSTNCERAQVWPAECRYSWHTGTSPDMCWKAQRRASSNLSKCLRSAFVCTADEFGCWIPALMSCSRGPRAWSVALSLHLMPTLAL